jgi:hypothetical protein
MGVSGSIIAGVTGRPQRGAEPQGIDDTILTSILGSNMRSPKRYFFWEGLRLVVFLTFLPAACQCSFLVLQSHYVPRIGILR